MWRSVRVSIAGLMGVVLVTAIGLAALRDASETWAGVTLLVTCGILALAVVGVVCGTHSERAWWLGFAVFGWGYLFLAFWAWNNDRARLPTVRWLATLTKKVGLTPQATGLGGATGGMGGMGGGMQSVPAVALQKMIFRQFGGFGGPVSRGFDESYAQIGHCLWALLFAFLGGSLAHWLFGVPAKHSEADRTDSDAARRPGRKRYARPAGIAVAALAIVATLLAVRSRSTPGFGAGAALLVTCGLLGLSALGAILDRERRGEIWLGATLFGAGYMILAFGRDPVPHPMPHLPTDQFLYALKAWLPRSAEGIFGSSESAVAANARIWTALDQVVPMHFRVDTPLEDVLQHVAQATGGPGGEAIPIYIDPIGMQEAEKTPQSTVVLDLEGVPLKTTLDICLKQLGLTYLIREGVLLITSQESADHSGAAYEDPFLVGGHSVLALLAAALGGLLSPMVSVWRRRPA